MNSSGDEDRCSSSTASSTSGEPAQRESYASNMDACREFYARRLQSLERFRQRLNAYQQHRNNDDVDDGRNYTDVNFMQLQTDMVVLMENDVSLTRQLMALGERIDELKSLAVPNTACSSSLSSSSSMVSLEDVCDTDVENDKTIRQQDESNRTDLTIAAASLSAEVRKLDENENENAVIELDDANEEDETDGDFLPMRNDMCPIPGARKQYFSRQNSVLRIPIPPGRHRSKTSGSSGNFDQHVVHAKINGESICELLSSSSDDAASSISSASSSSYFSSCVSRKSSSVASGSKCSSGRFSSNISDQIFFEEEQENNKRQSQHLVCHHASQSSCDSGVHHLNNAVDLFEREDLVFV